jgi:hypothetical protein
MHELLHIAVLASTVLGAATLALMVLWPALFDSPMPRTARRIAGGTIALAGVLFLVEWRVVH